MRVRCEGTDEARIQISLEVPQSLPRLIILPAAHTPDPEVRRLYDMLLAHVTRTLALQALSGTFQPKSWWRAMLHGPFLVPADYFYYQGTIAVFFFQNSGTIRLLRPSSVLLVSLLFPSKTAWQRLHAFGFDIVVLGKIS
jgi:hypothetical protein